MKDQKESNGELDTALLAKIDEIVKNMDCSDVEDILSEDGSLGDAESPFGLAGSKTYCGGTGERIDEE